MVDLSSSRLESLSFPPNQVAFVAIHDMGPYKSQLVCKLTSGTSYWFWWLAGWFAKDSFFLKVISKGSKVGVH